MIHFIIETISYYTIASTITIIISFIAMVFASIYLWKFFNIVFTPTTKIDRLKPGKVEIKGRVKAIDTILGIDRKAVYYKKLDEHYVNGKHGGWRVDKKEEEYTVFRVEDNTGEITVIPNSMDNFDIKYETIQHSSISRTRYFYLEDDEEVYVLGNMFRNNDGDTIGVKEGIPFIISDFKEINLIMKHSLYGFGITIVVVASISFMLFLASKEWNKSWEGYLQQKYTYTSGSGKNRSTHYMFKLEGNKSIETSSTEYDRVNDGDFLVKHKNRYDLEINQIKRY